MYLREKLPDAETTPAVGTLESLIAWLETKPATERYNYTSPSRCVMGQYSEAMTGAAWKLTNNLGGPLGKFKEIATGCYCTEEWTFGAALSRARNQQKYGTVFPSRMLRLRTWWHDRRVPRPDA